MVFISKYPILSVIVPEMMGPMNIPKVQLILAMETAREFPPWGPKIPGNSVSNSSTTTKTKRSVIKYRRPKRFVNHSQVTSKVPTLFSKGIMHPIAIIQIIYTISPLLPQFSHVNRSSPGIPMSQIDGAMTRKATAVGYRVPTRSLSHPARGPSKIPGPCKARNIKPDGRLPQLNASRTCSGRVVSKLAMIIE